MDDKQNNEAQETDNDAYPRDWSEPRPHRVPEPTYWPLVLAVGITFLALGIVTAIPLMLFGLALSIVAIVFWIGDIRREQRRDSREDSEGE